MNLYKAFGYQNPQSYKAAALKQWNEQLDTGRIDLNQYAEGINQLRRTGKTTNLAIRAIREFLNCKRVVVRAVSVTQLRVIKDYIQRVCPFVLTSSRIHFLIGTQEGNELRLLNYDILFDEPQLFRNY